MKRRFSTHPKVHAKHRMEEHFIRLVERVAELDEVVGIHGDRWGGSKKAQEGSAIQVRSIVGNTLHLQIYVKGLGGRLHVLTKDAQSTVTKLRQKFGAELHDSVVV